MSVEYIIYAVVLGTIPALIWLILWLQEDHLHPEPVPVLASAFFGGTAAAVVAALIQILIAKGLDIIGISNVFNITTNTHALPIIEILLLLLLMVIIEEATKLLAAVPALLSPANDEPVDPMMYLVIAALGFVVIENIIYVISSIYNGGLPFAAWVTTDRFLGASLIHIVSSGTIGYAIAKAHTGRHKSTKRKSVYIGIGFLVATLLHTAFNFSIISIEQPGIDGLIRYVKTGMAIVWIGVLVLLYLFHKIKQQKHYEA